jgi:hypothetical protein
MAACALVGGAFANGSDRHAPNASATQKACTKAVVGGKSMCLRAGQRCRNRFQSDYLLADLSCRAGKLRRASIAQRRHDDPVLVGEDGRVGLATALAAFDQTVADLPGIKARRGEIGELMDATFAIEEITAQEDKLTDAQRTVFAAATTPATSKQAPARRAVTPAEQQQGLQYVDDARRVMAAHGYAFPRPITLTFLDNQGVEGKNVLAYVSADDVVGRSNSCNIFITALGRAEPPDEKRVTLSHETAHCAQHAFFTSIAGALRVPIWVKEGGAQWLGATAAAEAAGVNPPSNHWSTWLKWTSFDLYTRTYPAVGFFSMLQQAGIDTYQRYQDVMRGAVAGGNAAAFKAAVAGVPKIFTDRWGPGFVRDPSLGPEWDLTGPGIIPSKPPKAKIGNGDREGWSTEPRGAVGVELVIRSDVFIVRTEKATRGLLRGSDGKQRKLQQGAYCVLKKCKCKTQASLQLPKIGSGSAFAGFGDQKKTRVAVFEGESLEDYCAKPGPGPAPDPGGGCSPKAGASCPLPPPGIDIRQLSEDGSDPIVATMKQGSCTAGQQFTAISTDGAYRLEIGIQAFNGFGQDYVIAYNDPDPEVIVEGPGGPYGNTQTSLPGPAGGGSIHFAAGGDVVSIGFVPAFNSDATAGLSIVGAMRCDYPPG